MKTSMRNLLLNLAAIGLLALFLVWAETNLDGYKVQILNLIAVNAILALSLNLIYGFTGMFSLGHAGFMAIGAYVSALCVLPAAQKEMMWILEDIIWPFSVIHTPFWFSVVAGGFVAAIFGLFIAIPVLRLGGDYLGIATLGFAEIIRVLIVNLTPITNGSLGIKGIPFHASLLVNYGWLLITLYCMVKLLGSNFGNIFKAIRDDEIAAKVMGIDTFRTKVLSFCLGAFFAGVGGALLGNLLTTIDPKMFTFLLTFNVLMIVVAGGLGSLTGSILGSAVITVLLEWLRAVEDPITLGGFAIPGIPGMRMVVFSLVLLCIILYRREGIMGMREITWDAIFDFFSRPVHADPHGVHHRAHRPQRRGQDHGLQRHQRLLQPPGRRHPVQGPQREGLPAAPDLQGGHGPDLPEHPALRQRNRAGKRHGWLSGPPQKPMVDARLQPAQRTARGRGNPREGEGPHPPPRARFLHGRKGVEPALRGAAAP